MPDAATAEKGEHWSRRSGEAGARTTGRSDGVGGEAWRGEWRVASGEPALSAGTGAALRRTAPRRAFVTCAAQLSTTPSPSLFSRETGSPLAGDLRPATRGFPRRRATEARRRRSRVGDSRSRQAPLRPRGRFVASSAAAESDAPRRATPASAFPAFPARGASLVDSNPKSDPAPRCRCRCRFSPSRISATAAANSATYTWICYLSS